MDNKTQFEEKILLTSLLIFFFEKSFHILLDIRYVDLRTSGGFTIFGQCINVLNTSFYSCA